MSTWFECKVKYDKMMENGMQKKVTEPYMVDALSFTEAEARIIKEMTPFISGDFSVAILREPISASYFLMRRAISGLNAKSILLRSTKRAVRRSGQRVICSCRHRTYRKLWKTCWKG